MASISYNKELGNYKVTNAGKSYTHATLESAERQLKAIFRVERKRANRSK